MGQLASLVNRILDALLAVTLLPAGGRPWLALLWVSLLTAAGMLVVFRLTSDQAAIRRVKDAIKGRFLEVWLFRDDPRVTFGALWRIAGLNLAYLRQSLVPLLIMLVPVLLLLVQLALRFERRPLREGEAVVVRVHLEPGADVRGAALEVPAGLALEIPPVRMADRHEIAWRMRAERAGRHALGVTLGGRRENKEVVVGGELATISVRRARRFADVLLESAEPVLAAPFEDIEVVYPRGELHVGAWGVHWLLGWLVLSVALGLVLKRPLGVEV